jgi:hypothetical protein
MKNTFLILVLCLPLSVSANPLDKVMSDLNNRYSPTIEGNTGYDFDYRTDFDSEGAFVWININHVKRECGVESISTLQNGHVITTLENRCLNRWIIAAGDSIMQIECKRVNKNQCIKVLAKEVTLEAVWEIISRRIEKVTVK